MLIYGKQPVQYALERHRDRIKTLYLAKEIDNEAEAAQFIDSARRMLGAI